MNKFKHALFNNKTEDKRTLQFLKLQNQAPFIGLTDLTEKEKPVYASWWKDLDPFDLDLISNEKILNFLKRCCLEDIKLEQILLLFETARDGLNKAQFFAMLRLIAHAQNGRNISRALIYLGGILFY
ncbi:hypothetical protein K501DRAFT_173398 [Backusella circina FSU 941]|nr:hypothetical protein K501DRAFT_173398 [Backusella circina FSU 941]